MLPRILSIALKRLAANFPIVAVTGPRQSGKTTLVRALFSHLPYVSLEDPLEREFARDDPKGFLARYPDGAVFDEAQRWPDLFSYLQGLVDTDRTPGRYVLTGSQQFGLMAGISQSLAGRCGMTQLLPLAVSELPANRLFDLDELILDGGYPAIQLHLVPRSDWFVAYVATYLERDVRQLLQVQDLNLFHRFLRLCAGRTGQLLNISALAGEAGIAESTARAWLSILEASYVIFLLPPYHRNFGKRLVKSVKLYFADVGLAAYLLGIRDASQLHLHPLRGALFETLVVTEFFKSRLNLALPPDLYFWRDNNGVEADLLFETAGGLQTVEIKSGRSPTADYVRAGQRSARFAGDEVHTPWLVYGGDESYLRINVQVISWRDIPKWLAPKAPG